MRQKKCKIQYLSISFKYATSELVVKIVFRDVTEDL